MTWIVTVGAGKGGVGKSLLSAALAYYFSQQAARLLLVDLDLGGCNLHSWFGLSPFSSLNLSRFFTSKQEPQELVVRLDPPGFAFLQGPSQYLQAPNLRYSQKKRLVQRLRKLPYPLIIADLGAGSHNNVVDFFLLGNLGILVLTPERTSIENAYRFLKVALLRHLYFCEHDDTSLMVFEEWLVGLGHQDVRDIVSSSPARESWFREHTQGIRIALILNQVEGGEEEVLGKRVAEAIAEHLLLPSVYLGALPFVPELRRFLQEPLPPLPRLLKLPAFSQHLARIGERLLKLCPTWIFGDGIESKTQDQSA